MAATTHVLPVPTAAFALFIVRLPFLNPFLVTLIAKDYVAVVLDDDGETAFVGANKCWPQLLSVTPAGEPLKVLHAHCVVVLAAAFEAS
jgi:hypothetical protein